MDFFGVRLSFKRGILVVASLCILMVSCSTEIEINAPNQDVPIVYCILDTEDTVQYVRVQKTYLTQQTNIPPDRDSIYFPGDIVVALERWENGKAAEVFAFEPYEQVKDSGFFPLESHVVFRTFARIRPAQTYYLYIYIQNKESVLFAETRTVGNLNVVDPMSLEQRKISLNIGQNYICRWQSVQNAGIYQVGVRFNYTETINGTAVQKSLDFPQPFTNPISNVDYLTREISGSRFFNILYETLQPVDGVIREAGHIDFYIIGGGKEIKYYIESTQPTDGALMEKPVFSNFSSGVGLFSSLARVEIKNLRLASTTVDSLAYSKLTKHLGFLDHNGDRDSTNNPQTAGQYIP